MEALITSLTALVCSLLAYVVVIINRKKDKEEQKHIIERVTSIEQAIDSDTDNDYYVVCPTCSTKIKLSKVKIFIEKKIKEDNNNASIT